jgi:KDO2-lipid IV(A) lauroyltransferase
VRDTLELGAYRFASAALRQLPLPAAQRIASRVAGALFDHRGRHARWALTNLRIAFPDRPESELLRLARASYVHFAWNLVDFARAERWSARDVLERVRFEGLEHARKALAGGSGAIVLTLHLGPFELAALAGPLVGLPFAIVARPMGNRALYRYVLRQRTRTGAVVIDRRSAARPILRSLREGRLVAILNDQYMRRSRAVFVPLFGARCATSAGLATLALRARAPVLTCYMLRVGPDLHEARILPPLEFQPTGDRERDIVELTARTNLALEEIIRAHPEQWMWGHRRFRHSPDLEGIEYR